MLGWVIAFWERPQFPAVAEVERVALQRRGQAREAPEAYEEGHGHDGRKCLRWWVMSGSGVGCSCWCWWAAVVVGHH